MYELIDYLKENGQNPLKEWLSKLADRRARARIEARIQRAVTGNLGDTKPVGEGVWELRIDYGPGYRVYYARAGKQVLLLLVGGDKRKQQTDIDTAVNHWQDWQKRQKL